jgi:uncharacterized protein YcfJ
VKSLTQSIVGVTAVAVGLLGVSGAALAAPPPWAHGYDARYDQGYDYARVVDVDPILREVRTTVPRRECWDESQQAYPEARAHSAASAGPTILGGIIGGVIGSQIGHGRGRSVATVAGTLLGAGIGHEAASRRVPEEQEEQYAEPEERIVQRCTVRYDERFDQQVDGYRVTYVYHGRQYTTRTPYDPGERIRIRVDVTPAAY